MSSTKNTNETTQMGPPKLIQKQDNEKENDCNLKNTNEGKTIDVEQEDSSMKQITVEEYLRKEADRQIDRIMAHSEALVRDLRKESEQKKAELRDYAQM